MDLQYALGREWLETNGLGGFASSTIAGLNTRRYHGLLIAATKPPAGRFVLVSRLEETLIVNGERYELAANQYPGAIHPRGYEYLTRFDTQPVPTFFYRAGGIAIRKSVFMVYRENTTVVEYEIDGGDQVSLEIRPLIAFRDYHSLTHRNDALNGAIVEVAGCLMLKPYADLPALYLGHNAVAMESTGEWYLNHEYQREQERGLDFQEDLFNPCVLRFEGHDRATIITSLDARPASGAAALRGGELRRRTASARFTPSSDTLVARLTAATDQYIVRRGDLYSIVAGYPWFTDWGRDTMIALPGIALVTGRFNVARDVLLAFASVIDRGMIPNRFPDTGETPEYNTVDATLWFFEAIRAYVEYSGDDRIATDTLYSRLIEILEWHLRGTRYGIHVDSDGLLASGEPGSQLTWMDAKIGEWVVTPRHGKPVEIQALWYNALRVMEQIAVCVGDTDRSEFLAALASKVKTTFETKFWRQDGGYLFDCIRGNEADASMRPNQIFAISLHHAVFEGTRALQVVDAVRRELLTPMGLRTLARSDSRYRPRYEGGVSDRDSSYHQGTVWPWLMGPFLTAFIRVHGRSEASRRQAAEWLRAFEHHLDDACVGQISELADAEPPHTPRGCIAQAWSVAELLRTAVEDVFQIPVTERTLASVI